MAYYAFINENNIVVEVIGGRDETEGDWETYYSNLRGMPCLRTSYNAKIRKQFAGIGFTYDPDADVFIRPQPFPSWTLDANHDWQAPTPKPEGDYYWDEDTETWVPF
jgi:hypothetical protein